MSPEVIVLALLACLALPDTACNQTDVYGRPGDGEIGVMMPWDAGDARKHTSRANSPAAQRLKELFYYHEDGYFIRRIATGPSDPAGAEVRGTLGQRGYLQIGVDGRTYALHRMVFLWHHGWVPEIVDHYPDRTRTNCRITNLRAATHSQSNLNRGLHRNNTTGFTGVSPAHGMFSARPMRDGARVFLGYFDTIEEAATAINDFDTGRRADAMDL